MEIDKKIRKSKEQPKEQNEGPGLYAYLRNFINDLLLAGIINEQQFDYALEALNNKSFGKDNAYTKEFLKRTNKFLKDPKYIEYKEKLEEILQTYK